MNVCAYILLVLGKRCLCVCVCVCVCAQKCIKKLCELWGVVLAAARRINEFLFFCCFFVSKIVVNNRSVSANFSWANSKIHFFTQLRYALNKRWRGKMQMGEKKAGEGGRSVMVSKLQILFTEQTG